MTARTAIAPASTAPPLLSLQNVEKGFFGVPVLRGVSLSVRSGSVLSLIGENGAGKSTLMNVLGGVLPADGGEMHLRGRPYRPAGPKEARAAGIAFIHQELNLFTNLSVAENIFIDAFPRTRALPLIHRSRMLSQTRELLARVELEIEPDITVERLAPGERQLVEIAKALHSNAELIIFDEPTTSLTARETERLFALIGRLREQGTAMIYISHVLGDVKRLSDDIAVLRDGDLTAYGPAEQFNIPQMISSMVGRDLCSLYPAKTNKVDQRPLLEVIGLTQPGMVKDVNFCVHTGEVVGIFGLMGSGRTETARMIFGLDDYASGSVRLGEKVLPRLDPISSVAQGLAFVTENRREEGLLMDMSILENMGLASFSQYSRGGWINFRAATAKLRELLTTLNVRSLSPDSQPVRSLSGGNQQKVVLGKWLATRPRVFILDEPTRGIDVGAKYEVYSIINDLASRGNGVLVISSELEELMGICDRILVMAVGEVQAEFCGPQFNREKLLRAAFREADPPPAGMVG